ncbi:hypothetical protein KDN32_21520 [Nocardioides sp. J2M5]|uniref:hypothetical protein n=1 Tax=Nocardioides palaemonis TaxID=2829810 RepID=UPI001BAD4D3F|nr:hypothetical protein [Nocardioides palaemonis]MBS2940324.1 hypothetical protein [Nocardioides palaemonis]
MYSQISRLVDQLDSQVAPNDVLGWACPVPFFGEIALAKVATVGINPSNREFVDKAGTELAEPARRLPTLSSLGRASWDDATGDDIRSIALGCRRYFQGNPYRQWFDVLDRMLCAGGASYYDSTACHVDLVAYATSTKWGILPGAVRDDLMRRGRSTIAELIRDSAVDVLVLNGRAVVSEFVQFADASLVAREVDSWTLPRSSGTGVGGIAYEGVIDAIGEVAMDRSIRVIGYNHNLQSSFGVTTEVMQRIGEWVGATVASATAS